MIFFSLVVIWFNAPNQQPQGYDIHAYSLPNDKQGLFKTTIKQTQHRVLSDIFPINSLSII
jgi:hypothetical protein